MCWPFTHKWKTLSSGFARTYSSYSDGSDLPVGIQKVITQQCENCGKEIVRKYKL